MAKRFLDTGFLDQLWIRKLAPDKKIFLIYLMLKCDNAGIIELDFDDASFWIGKKIENLDFLPKGYLIPINGSGKYFMPKFIEWQYPDLSSSKHIIVQARQLLDKYGLIDSEFRLKLDNIYVNVTKDLPELQVTSNSKGIGKGGVGGKTQEEQSINFYKIETDKAKGFTDNMSEEYIKLARHICQKAEDGTWRMNYLLKVKNQLSLNDFSKLFKKVNGNTELIMAKIDSFQTNVNYYKKYIDIYLSVNKWLTKD